jgi:DNA-binding PadR family transcriptional regulator
MVLASLVLVPVAIIAGGQLRWDPSAWAAVLAAGVGCSGLGWLANTALVQRVGAARSSIVSYTSVLVSVTLGAALLDEPVTARVVVGVVVIVAAVAVFLLPPAALTRLATHLPWKERIMLELCILGFLAEAPMHAYELRRRITALTGHVRPISDGALSPATKRLEARGLLTRTTAPGEGGPARVVLHLTDEGRTELLRRLAAADGAEVTDRNRWFAVLAFLHHLTDSDRQRAVLERRLAFLEDPGRGFFVAGGDGASVFREGMATMADATWRAEHAWLRRTLVTLDA